MPIIFSSSNVGFNKTAEMVKYYVTTEPVITSVDPEAGAKRQTLYVVITGTTLTSVSVVSFGSGITVNSFVVDSATQITANITIATSATSGLRNVWVLAPAGVGVLWECFTVLKTANYILAQAYNTGLTAAQVLSCSGAIPLVSNFSSTALWTDNTGFGKGYFSEAPGGRVAYCNGVDTCIWGGDEIDQTGFIVSTAADTPTNPADYADVLRNTRHDTENTALIGGAAGRYFFIRSPVPLQGVRFYIDPGNENASASTLTGWEWDGDSWAALSLTDGTKPSTFSMAQDGAVTFGTTVATSKQHFLEGALGYWYQFNLDAGSVKLYYVTLDAPFQQVVDIWDGLDNMVAACFKYTTVYENYTINVLEDLYDSADATTYLNLSSMGAYAAGANCVIMGFFEKMLGFNIGVASDKTNSTAATTAAVDYWDGAAFTTVGAITDGTSEGAISLSKTGTITFNPPASYLVFKRVLSDNSVPLYYYRLRFDKAMDASTAIYYISGIPAQKTIRGYKFPLYSQDRLMLCCNMDGERNSILVSATETCQVFNGDDSFEEAFGNHEELTSGCTVFAQYGSNLFNITVLFKEKEMWGFVFGSTEWIKYLISPTIGCPAPSTLDVVIVPPLEEKQSSTANRCYAIWMGADGVYVSEGRHPMCVSDDIRDIFDQNATTHINQSYIESFSGHVDKARMEYHLFVALTTGTVTTLDAEYVLDLKRWKWFKIDRASGKKIQCAISVTDVYGNPHSYGFLDTGYMERLENGTDFDGNSIVSTLHTGDIPLQEDDMFIETSLKAVVPVIVAKTETTADITLTHYTDTATTGTEYTIDPTSSGYRLAFPVKLANSVPGLFHAFKMVITTDDEGRGFEPLVLGLYYSTVREHNYN